MIANAMFIFTVVSNYEFCFLAGIKRRFRCWQAYAKSRKECIILNIWKRLYILLILFYYVSWQIRPNSSNFLSKVKSTRSFFIDGYHDISRKICLGLSFSIFSFCYIRRQNLILCLTKTCIIFVENTHTQ